MSEKIKHLYEIVNGKLEIHPHTGQLKAWDSKKRFIFVFAGTQGGKTEFGPIWMMREMKKKGEGDYMAISPSFPLMSLKLLPAYRRFFCDILKIGDLAESKKILRINGKGITANLFFGSADKPDSLESATAKAVHLDEVGQSGFRLQSWEAVQRRLSINEGRVLGTTTLYNLGWLKGEIYDRWKAGAPDIDVIQFESIMNPVFPKTEYNRARSVLPTWKFNMFYRGQFDRPAGMIYDCWEDSTQKIAPIVLDPAWPRHVGVDFGGVHTAALWYAEHKVNDSVTNYYLYREYLGGGKSIKEHAKDFKNLSAGEDVKNWVGGSKSEEQWRIEFQNAGLPMKESGIKDVEVGIQRVYGLKKLNRVYVFNTCGGYLDENGSYSRKLNDAGQPTEEIEDKNEFHFMDAERYILGFLADDAPDAAGTGTEFNRNDYRRNSIWDR